MTRPIVANIIVIIFQGTTKLPETARVISGFEGRKSDELSVRKDDVVIILEKDVKLGWSKATIDGVVGLLPDNSFKLLPPEEVKAKKVTSRIGVLSLSNFVHSFVYLFVFVYIFE